MLFRSKRLLSLVLVISLAITPALYSESMFSSFLKPIHKVWVYLAYRLCPSLLPAHIKKSMDLAYAQPESKQGINHAEILLADTPIAWPKLVPQVKDPQANAQVKDKKPAPAVAEFAYPDYASWKKACKKLPAYLRVGSTYAYTALDWQEFNTALERFFAINKAWYAKHAASWVENAPQSNDYFFNVNAQIFAPFVQKSVVSPYTTIGVRGDLHGDIHSLIAYIDFMQQAGYMNGFKIIKSDFNLLFLGDYVDRGNYGVEVLYTLMRLKIANPDQVMLVRGNHEDIKICSNYGFRDEVEAKFGMDFFGSKFKKIARLYDFLPAALYLGCGSSANKDFLQCCHGGMEVGFNPTTLLQTNSPVAFKWIDVLHQATEFQALDILHEECEAKKYFKNFKITHYTDIGFMWNDFHVPNDTTLCLPPESRGFVYGKNMTRAVLKRASKGTHKVRGVLRAHQHAGKMDDMMASIIDPHNKTNHKGLSKLWKDTAITGDMWDGMVCTFLVAPDSCYSCNGSLFDFDAFALLKTGGTFDQWKLTVHRNKLSDIIAGCATS